MVVLCSVLPHSSVNRDKHHPLPQQVREREGYPGVATQSDRYTSFLTRQFGQFGQFGHWHCSAINKFASFDCLATILSMWASMTMNE